MKPFKKYFTAPLLLCGLLISHHCHATAIHLSRHPGSALEKAAASLNTDVIKDSQAHGEKPVIFIASAHLGSGKDPEALFVQIQSGRLCGAAGCATSIYLLEKGKWINILDAVNGEISVLSQRHHGMADILIDKTDKWIWDGQHYVEAPGSNN